MDVNSVGCTPTPEKTLGYLLDKPMDFSESFIVVPAATKILTLDNNALETIFSWSISVMKNTGILESNSRVSFLKMT